MREFKSLRPRELPRIYNVETHGEEPIVKVEEKEGRITVQYTFPGFYLSDDERDVEKERIPFKQVTIAHTGFLGESGKPLLPSFGRYVQIPFNCEYTITVEKSESVQFDDITVAPAQANLTDSPEEEHVFEYDKEFYLKDQFYPEDVVNVSGPFEINGYNSLLLHVRPLQYNPAKKKVIGFGTITVTIDITPKEPSEYALAHPALDKEAYGNLFLNPKRGIEKRLGIDTRVMAPSSNTPSGPEFLIIYHDTFKKAAENLAKWKNKRGLRTVAVSITEMGNTVESIKRYIRKMRGLTLSRLRYVLLFGDTDVIIPETIPESPSGENVTDYYCSTERDPVSTTQYVFPWLSVGRIPVKTAEEGLTVVDQIIAYEKNPPEDPEYYKRMVFAAYFEDRWPKDGKANKGYMKTMEYIREHMVDLGFEVERVYTTNNEDMTEYHDSTPIPEEVKDAVIDEETATSRLVSVTSKGCLIIGHRDHGRSTGWVDPPFEIKHLNAVTGETPTMFYSINCLTGKFDVETPTDSFAEKLLKMKGGAPSLIAATRASYTWLNDDLMKALFDAMWAGVLHTFGSTASYPIKYNRLGDVLNYAKTYLPVVSSGIPERIKDHFEIYHVIGDPTLELWKTKPLDVKMHVVVKKWHMVIVLSRCPKNSVITVWDKDKMLKRIEPSSNHIRIPLRDISLTPVTRRKIFVCFWAPGCMFKKAVV
ncbi:MAG: hypothetical protein AYK19_11280 [Theionarchaea archaeon DG-70-1]|nr:MAG: hypothetical protein AYK19_11280 [Theionarchaea archaeon DG-70-1]